MCGDYYIKICGLTQPDDALEALRLGADFIGMVLHSGSPRYCDPIKAKEMIRKSPGKPKVLVFGYDPAEYIIQLYTRLHDLMTFVQLPADSDAFLTVKATLTSGRIFPSIHVENHISDKVISSHEAHSFLILDTPTITVDGEKLAGGTGKTFNWNFVKDLNRPYLLAGGLNPSNIVAAAKTADPFGFDISSGLESQPGIKDPLKMKHLFENLSNYKQ